MLRGADYIVLPLHRGEAMGKNRGKAMGKNRDKAMGKNRGEARDEEIAGNNKLNIKTDVAHDTT